MAKRISKKGNIIIIFTAIVVIAVFLISAFISESQWDKLFEKAGISGVTDSCGMSVHFIDVGQGDCTLIKLESGENILIDSGEDIKAEKVKSYLKKEKIDSFEYCFVTHPHTDHFGGMTDILSEVPAKTLVMPSIPAELLPDDDEYTDFKSFISKNISNIIYTKAGEEFTAGDAKLEILGPLKDNKDLNAMSLVIKLTLGNSSFMICGDSTEDEERDITETYDPAFLRCSVLRVGHHGSEKSTCDEWLDTLAPDAAVISVGRNNDFSHPSSETLARLDNRGIRYYRTDICGDIVFKVQDDRIEVLY